MTNRTLFLAALSLVAAPILAGCAQNGDTGGDDTNLELTMGSLMPLTGALNALGTDMERGAKLAVQQINDANVGLRINALYRDDATTDSAGIPNKFNQLVGEGATAIAGPCCSGVTAAVLDLAKQEQVLVASPSATSPSLTEGDNGGFFLRVAPSDAQQGSVLANLVADDGVTSVGIIAVNNAYGNGLLQYFKQSAQASVPPIVVVSEAKYEENAPGDMSSQVTAVCGGAVRPDAIMLFAYVDDGANALKAMQSQGCLSEVQVYGSEGIWDPQLVEKAGTDAEGNHLAAGVKGTAPGVPSAFVPVFNASYGAPPRLYSAESYDAVMYIALAAIAAGSTDGPAMAAEVPAILNGPGTKFTADRFAEAARALQAGDDIDFDGYSHDFEFDAEKREPLQGAYSVWQVAEDGSIEIIAENQRPA